MTVIGPRDQGFTRRVLDAYATPPGPPLVGGGRARLSLVYVKDVARVLATVARHPYAVGETFNVGGCSTTWRAFIATVCAELGVPTPRPGLPFLLATLLERCAGARHAPLSPALVGRTRVYSDARLTRTLHYQPAYDLLEAIHETVAWRRRMSRVATPLRTGRASPVRLLS